MRVFRGLDEIPGSFGPSVVSVGNFDGVHRGHCLILRSLVESARTRAVRSIAVTFDPHPLRILRPDSSPRLITPLDARLELLEATGVDAVLVMPFTAAVSRMRASEFAATVLHDALRAVEVHEGSNFRFGYRAEAGIEELSELGRKLGFSVLVHPPCAVRGVEASSSRIRELVSRGDLRTSRLLLGHAFFIRSTPARGRGLGSTVTVPTINLALYSELLPPNGVYVTRLRVGHDLAQEWFDAVTNIGNRPTFGADSFAIESHLLDFHPMELNPETPLKLVLLQKIRDERHWPTAEALKSQILRDVAHARRYLRLQRLLQTR